jgi:hypothetical protein
MAPVPPQPQSTSTLVGPNQPQSTVSLSDLLTAMKNLVQGINNQSTTNQNVSSGLANRPAITIPTIVKVGPGIVASYSVTTAGSIPGMIYDASKITDTSSPLVVIQEAVGFYPSPHPVTKGIFIFPGAGQSVTVFYS